MPLGSMRRMARTPHDRGRLSKKGWDVLIGVIEDTLRAYPELHLDAVVQDAVFGGGRSCTETFANSYREWLRSSESWSTTCVDSTRHGGVLKRVQAGGATKAAFLTDGNYDEDMAGMGELSGRDGPAR